MQRIGLFLVLGVLVWHSLWGHSKSKPNLVVIYADDLGWKDLSCYGSTFYETPNLDRLAKEGIRFRNGYASAPVCSPSRASLMTGKYPIKSDVTDWLRGRQADGKAQPYEKMVAKPIVDQLALSEKTFAELALENGYQTFFAGKWHLGEQEQFWPEKQGFQTNKGGTNKGSPTGVKNDSTGGFFTPYANPRLVDGPPGEYLTDRLTNECLEFLKQQKESPFVLVYSLYAVHNPLQAPRALVEKYQQKQRQLGIQPNLLFRKDEPWMAFEAGWKQRTIQSNPVYAAMIENMDYNVGRILDQLAASGLAENTLVVFSSDNGGLSTAEGSPTTNDPLRAGKGWLYEGGIRVPVIVRWPAKIAAGQVSDVPVNTIDFYPTFANAIHQSNQKEQGVDGEDILKLIAKPDWAKKRTMYWHYPHYSNQGGKPGSAIIQYPFKLIQNHEDKSLELYNLMSDVGETNNLAKANSALAKKLQHKLQLWLLRNKAKFPDKNPGYVDVAIGSRRGLDDH